MIITKSALRSALRDDRNQPIEEFREARDVLFRSMLEDAANNPRFDEFDSVCTIGKLFIAPSERQAAIEKVRAVRRTFVADSRAGTDASIDDLFQRVMGG